MKKMHTMKFLTVDDIDDLEEEAVVDSPRSIEACLREGIQPIDLIYIPEEEFMIGNMPPDMRHLHYEFFEAKRKELLFNVRRIRKNIISEQESITRSSTAIYPSVIAPNKQDRREKAIKIKLINVIVDRENLLKDVFKQRESEFDFSIEQTHLESIQEAVEAKKRHDKSRFKKQERANQIHNEEETKEKLRGSLDNKYMNKLQKIIEMNEEKLLEIDEKKQHNEEKTLLYNEKMKKTLEKIHNLRKQHINECDATIKQRLEKMIDEKIHKQKVLEMKWNAKIKRKNDLKDQIKSDIINKQIEYYKVKEISDKKYEEFFAQKDKPKEHTVQIDKIIKVTESNENIKQMKKDKLDNKIKNFIVRMDKQKYDESKKLNYKMNLSLLKKAKKNWNLERNKSKNQYSQSMAQMKYEIRSQKIEVQSKQKSVEINKKLHERVEKEIRNRRLSEEIIKMSITQKWNKQQLLSILNSDSQIKETLKSQEYH